uniref:Uncharacterized protein n=1 Tax=Rhizophagus irregularis (strain DAOM 181602 / DAOM 197198 / MUCL 43194) TaxID=747089 RepID=U9UK96_RHIID
MPLKLAFIKYRTLQVTCGVEFLTLVIPLSEKLNISYFGTSVGEEYKTNDSFYHFSCLKKSDIEELKDITMLENTDDQLSIIDKEYPNSKNTCDKVRKYLQEKCILIYLFLHLI